MTIKVQKYTNINTDELRNREDEPNYHDKKISTNLD